MISHSLREAALRSRLVRADKVCVFFGGSGNGVDATNRWVPDDAFYAERVAFPESHHIPPDAAVIGYVSRLSREKGVPELAEAWLALRDRFPRACFVLAGPPKSHGMAFRRRLPGG